MGWIRWRRDQRLQPLIDLHDEFSARPHARELLADAEHELTRREYEHARCARQRS